MKNLTGLIKILELHYYVPRMTVWLRNVIIDQVKTAQLFEVGDLQLLWKMIQLGPLVTQWTGTA